MKFFKDLENNLINLDTVKIYRKLSKYQFIKVQFCIEDNNIKFNKIVLIFLS